VSPEPLFDPEPYTVGTPRKPRVLREVPDVPIEPMQPGWTYVRNRRGVLPYTHLIASTTTLGSVLTRCGQSGTTLSNAGVEVMRRCPECDIDLQLA
jgi:hypothetical protein